MALKRNKMNEQNATQNKTEGVVPIGSKELLACPFCGGKVTLQKCKCIICRTFKTYWKVNCKCGAGFSGYDPFDVIDQWNHRAG